MSPDESRELPTAPATGGASAGPATSVCALCGRLPGCEPVIRTSQSGLVHIACADRAARGAWFHRRRAALGHALIAALTLLALGCWAGLSYALLGMAVAWGGLHLITHRRFWHYVLRDARRTLRRRS